MRNNPSVRTALACAALLGGLFLAPAAFHFLPVQGLELAVDAELEKGNTIEVYINNDFTRSLTNPIRPGERFVYRFGPLSEKITSIRLDPTDSPTARIKLCEISIRQNGKALLTVDAKTLAAWGPKSGLESTGSDAVCASFVATSNDPLIYGGFAYQVSRWDSLLNKMGGDTGGLQLRIILAALALVFLLGLKDSPRSMAWALLPLALLPIDRWISGSILGLSHFRLDVAQSVGNSGFSGQPKSLEIFAFRLTLLLSVLSGIFCFALWKWTGGVTRASESHQPRTPAFSYFSLGTGAAVFSLFGFPKLKPIYESLAATVHDTQWDSVNILTWQYLAQQGWLPFKDYWFPYGGLYNQLAPFPWDMARAHLHNAILFAALLVSVYILTGRRKRWTLLVLAPVLFLSESGYLRGLPRYFLSLDVVLLYVALGRLGPIDARLHATFGAFMGWVFWYEPAQLIYAAPALAATAIPRVLEAWPDRTRRRTFLGAQLAALGVCAAFAAAFFMGLARHGQLAAYLDFYRHMGAMAASCSTPGSLPAWHCAKLAPEHLVFLLTHAFVLLGIYWTLRDREEKIRWFGDVALGVGLLGAMIFHKHLLRPHMASQFIGLYVVGGLLLAAEWSRRWNAPQKLAGLFALGAALSLARESGALSSVWEGYVRQAPGVLGNLAVLAKDGEEIARTQRAYFAPERFTQSAELRAVYEALLRRGKSGAIPDFYVFGDEAYFYIMAGKKPPRYITFYDGSALAAQREMVGWLDGTKPLLVLWNPEFRSFDGVPNSVRVPLLYEHIVRNYRFQEQVAGRHILALRPANAGIDAAYWRKNLGEKIDLGHLPRESSVKSLDGCRPDSPLGCVEFLEIRLAEMAASGTRNIHFQVGGLAFQVEFTPEPGYRTYHILLDRLWFWGSLKKAGMIPALAENQDASLSLRIVPKSQPDFLY